MVIFYFEDVMLWKFFLPVFFIMSCLFASPCQTFTIDWLYWRASEENLFVATHLDDFTDPVFKHAQADLVTPGMQFQSGVRAIWDAPLPHCWHFSLTGSYIPIRSTTVHDSVPGIISLEHGIVIIPNTSGFPVFNSLGTYFFTTIEANWRGYYTYFDVDLRRALYFGDRFVLEPHIGFRAAWMKQKLRVRGTTGAPVTNGATFVHFTPQEKFQGYGIEGGLFLTWNLIPRFSIWGHVGGSLLASLFTVKQPIQGLIGANGPVVVDIDVNFSNYWNSTPVIDCVLGLEYDMRAFNRYCSLHALWEQHTVFRANQLAVSGGELSLMGLTFGLKISFSSN